MIITIARQCGCGALRVGEALAVHYNVPFYTREQLKKMARERGILGEMDDFFEERPVDDLIFAISSDFQSPKAAKHSKQIEMLTDMIGNENCIIIGRCGNYIFRNRQDLVSVFLKGDIHVRIRNVEEEQGMKYQDAKEFVTEVDDRRKTYHKFHTGLTWGNSDDYDLCIDSCRLSAENTAQLIEQYIDKVEDKRHTFA